MKDTKSADNNTWQNHDTSDGEGVDDGEGEGEKLGDGEGVDAELEGQPELSPTPDMNSDAGFPVPPGTPPGQPMPTNPLMAGTPPDPMMAPPPNPQANPAFQNFQRAMMRRFMWK